MKPSDEISLIAPCGMNCGVCMAYLREKNKCTGCRETDDKPVSIQRCKIRTCDEFQAGKAKFCFECGKHPCAPLKHLDKRYRTKYHMSMIENLEHIRQSGTTSFLESEQARWTCPACGGVICVHKSCCSGCGRMKRIGRGNNF